MINRDSSTVVIPTYKLFADLNEKELRSLESTCKHLVSYSHILVAPEDLDWKGYRDFYRSYGINIIVEVFKRSYFNDVEGYNDLLKSYQFYEAFKNYKYILIFQTDALIIRDDFDFWCNKGYAYIGAPWFEDWGENPLKSKIIGVGNGGFSLRNVRATIRILKRANKLKKMRGFWFKSRLQSLIRFENFIFLFRGYFKLRNWKNVNDIFLHDTLNEDHYLSQTLANLFSDYKVAPIEDAIKFSFEVNPSLLYKLNHNQLPFGCHAWEKNEPEFWSSMIDNG